MDLAHNFFNFRNMKAVNKSDLFDVSTFSLILICGIVLFVFKKCEED